MAVTSGVSIKAHCTRSISELLLTSMSPRPMSCCAPVASSTVLESMPDATLKAIRAGKFAFITPVITLALGRCVANMTWMPIARAFWASRAIGVSTSLPAVIIKSANSSTMTTIYGMNLCPFSGLRTLEVNLALYSLIFLTPAIFNRS